MNKGLVFTFSVLFLIILSCSKDIIVPLDGELKDLIKSRSKDGSLDYFIMPSSNDFVNLPNQDPHNPITAEKVELGQMLFFETGLAQTPLKEDSYETYSCSSCHIPSKGFLP